MGRFPNNLFSASTRIPDDGNNVFLRVIIPDLLCVEVSWVALGASS